MLHHFWSLYFGAGAIVGGLACYLIVKGLTEEQWGPEAADLFRGITAAPAGRLLVVTVGLTLCVLVWPLLAFAINIRYVKPEPEDTKAD